MKPSITLILKLFGISSAVTALVMLLPFVISLIYSETKAAKGFCISLLICVFFGMLTYVASNNTITFKNTKTKIYNRESILILVTFWVGMSFFGALPLFFSREFPNFANALFEACSGFTTTGATTTKDIESISRSIILWRSLLQWIGALSVITFAVKLFPALFIDGTAISSPDKPTLSFPNTIKRALKVVIPIFIFYMLATLIMTLILRLAGLSRFDSVICSLGTLSTGGFSNYNDELLHFNSNITVLAILLFMLATGLSVNLIFSSIRKHRWRPLKHHEHRVYIYVIIISAALIATALIVKRHTYIPKAIFNSLFTAVSIITTTGYTISDYTIWPVFCVVVMILLLMCGSCSTSVGSGNKIIRYSVITKLVMHGIETRLHPNAISKIKIGKKDLPAETVSSVANYIFLYFMLMFIGAVILATEGLSMSICISDSLSLISNTGVSIEIPGHINTIGDYHALTKLLLCIIMIAGRLELFNVIVMFMPSFWRVK